MEFDSSIFLAALTSEAFAEGALITIALALASHALAIVAALPLAIILNGRPGPAVVAVKLYVGLFRAAPTLLQLLFVWNALPQFLPVFRGPWFTPFLAALITLSLNETAYQVEINRAALRSVDPGQRAAGLSLGLTRAQVLFRVIVPQALRVAIPPTANEFINLLKVTSLASVISLRELITVTSQAVSVTFRFAEYYAAALVYYLVIVGVLTFFQARLERKLTWSTRASGGAPTALQSSRQPVAKPVSRHL